MIPLAAYYTASISSICQRSLGPLSFPSVYSAEAAPKAFCHTSAGCIEALAEERALILALWLVHRPPSQTLLQLALRLLHALAPTPAAAWAACAQGGAVYLLTHLLPTSPTPPADKVGRLRLPISWRAPGCDFDLMCQSGGHVLAEEGGS